MTIEEAVALLEYHQKWRRGADIPQTDPVKLTVAIDVVIAHHKARKDDLK